MTPYASIASLPFFNASAGCYPLELLAAITRHEGFDVWPEYSYIDFALEYLAPGEAAHLYYQCANVPNVADAVLCPLLSGWDERRDRERLSFLARNGIDAGAADRLLTAFDRHLDAVADRIGASRIVALTATHYQLLPSLLLAQRLRRAGSAARVAVGGYFGSLATARDIMVEHGGCLDILVYGEAEDVWPRILADPDGVHGVVRGGSTSFGRHLPTHDEVLDKVAGTWLADKFVVSLEHTRGCYWDVCDFCNFNAGYDGIMKKVPSQDIFDSMAAAARTHGPGRFQFIDTALPRSFGRDVEDHGVEADYEFFAELRAEWSRRDLERLSHLGRPTLQIGIEAVSDDYLRAMKKNATVEQNIAVLRHCRDLGIEVKWGLMIGHPYETEAMLAETLRFLQDPPDVVPPAYITMCEIRPGSVLWRDRDSFGFDVRFPTRFLDHFLAPRLENCNFLPAVVSTRHEPRSVTYREISRLVDEWRLRDRARQPA